jgi:hypothetical protein
MTAELEVPEHGLTLEELVDFGRKVSETANMTPDDDVSVEVYGSADSRTATIGATWSV